MRMADMQRTSVNTMTVNAVRIGYDGRELRYQLDGLAHQVIA